MALPNGRRVGELRVDPADSLKYRWTGSAWIVDGTGTPSSAGFPTGRYVGDVREDKTTGRSYNWNGSAWALLANENKDVNQDGVFDIPAGSVTATELAASSVTETKLGAAAVAKSKLKYTVETVTITAATSGTATVTSGAQILGYHVSAVTGAGIVKSMSITATTLTVNLSVSDTATVQVIVLEP